MICAWSRSQVAGLDDQQLTVPWGQKELVPVCLPAATPVPPSLSVLPWVSNQAGGIKQCFPHGAVIILHTATRCRADSVTHFSLSVYPLPICPKQWCKNGKSTKQLINQQRLNQQQEVFIQTKKSKNLYNL